MSEQASDNTVSFRERTMQRLSEEVKPHEKDLNMRRDPEPEREPLERGRDDLDDQDIRQDADQLEPDNEPESLQPIEDSDQPEDEPGEGVETDDESEPDDTEITALRVRAEEAEQLVNSMQADYTRKTQQIAQTKHELTESLDQSRRIAEIYAERASAEARRYENVDWQQLQMQLSPEQYQQQVQHYRQVTSLRDRAIGEHEQIKKFADEQVEKVRQREAEVSRDILRSTVPNWGPEMYSTLKDHATRQWGFSAEEIDQVTDHRVIQLLHASWKMSQTGKKIDSIQHQNGLQPRPGRRNKPQPRDPKSGRYLDRAKNNLVNNPGDRNATRSYFEEKLRMEREGRRR